MTRTGTFIRNIVVALFLAAGAMPAMAQSEDQPLSIEDQIRLANPSYNTYEVKIGWLLLGAAMLGILCGLMWYSRWNFRRGLRRVKPSAVIIAQERKARGSDGAPKPIPKRVRREEKSRQRTPKKKLSARKPRDEHSDSWSRRKWRW